MGVKYRAACFAGSPSRSSRTGTRSSSRDSQGSMTLWKIPFDISSKLSIKFFRRELFPRNRAGKTFIV